MKTIILDLGSGNTCKNDPDIIIKMIDAIPYSPRIILKFQLFQEAWPNIPLDKNMFIAAYEYAKNKKYLCTASVFDLPSLNFLLQFDIPFVKLANRPELYHLTKFVPRGIPVWASYTKITDELVMAEKTLVCISKYPSKIEDYEQTFCDYKLRQGISDHTVGIKLYKKYKPKIYECHYKLEDSTGLDAGEFAKTPDEIRKILEVEV